MKTMTTQDHIDKAIMILDNIEKLYFREQAIFKVNFRDHDPVQFHRQLKDLSREVVARTNLVESNDPFISGKMFDDVASGVYNYTLDEYQVFLQDQKAGL